MAIFKFYLSLRLPFFYPGQAGRGSELPDLVEDVPVSGSGVGLDFKGPFQPKLFYDSMILS